MAIQTIFRDNKKSGYREAWQHSEKVFEWAEREIHEMHKEAPQSVHPWGTYPEDAKVVRGKRYIKRRASANEQN